MFPIFLKAFVSLFVVMDPIGNIPVFLAVTKPLDPDQRKRAFSLSVLVAFFILLVFSLVGQFVLDQIFEIKIADIQIAGGILLFLIAVQNLLTPHVPQNSNTNTLKAEEIACVPLACPLLAGPGAMVTSLTIWHGSEEGPLAAVTAMALVLGLFWVLMRFVDKISQVIGKLIITAISKVMLILVASMGVKMTIQGILYYFPNG